MSFKNYLKFYFKRMPIITLILTAFVTKGGILGSAFSSIVGFFLVLVFYMPVANTILSIFCYPVYAMFNKGANIDTSKDNGFKYVLALALIWFYSFLVGSFLIGMLGVLAPESTQELFYEFNNIKESFYYLMGDDPTFWIFIFLVFLTLVTAIPKLITAFSNVEYNWILLTSAITSLNFIFYRVGLFGDFNIIKFIFITYYTSAIVDLIYRKSSCTEIGLKFIPKKYFIYFGISFLIAFITVAIISIGNIYMIIYLPNIVYIILMTIVIKKYLPKKTQ